MKVENKKFVISILINGLFLACITAGFDYHDGRQFNIFKYIFMFSFFGLFMGLLTRYNYKKQLEKSNSEIIKSFDE